MNLRSPINPITDHASVKAARYYIRMHRAGCSDADAQDARANLTETLTKRHGQLPPHTVADLIVHVLRMMEAER